MKCPDCICLTSARKGVLVIGWLFVVISILSLTGCLMRLVAVRKGEIEDTCQSLIHDTIKVTLANSVVVLAIGVSALVAVHREIPFFLAIAVALLVINILTYIFLAFWLMECFALFLSYLISTALHLYFLSVFTSYYREMRRTSMYVIEEVPRDG